MIRVLIESPFAGRGPTAEKDREENLRYLRMAMNDCFKLNEAPFASHGLYTQPGVLDDDIPEERTLGIDAGLVWGRMADKTVVYVDRGISNGMIYGIRNAKRVGRPVEIRSLVKWWETVNDSEAYKKLPEYLKIANDLRNEKVVP